jgi:hypothetical protein
MAGLLPAADGRNVDTEQICHLTDADQGIEVLRQLVTLWQNWAELGTGHGYSNPPTLPKFSHSSGLRLSAER